MSDDLIERLRKAAMDICGSSLEEVAPLNLLLNDGAAEIERLRAALEKIADGPGASTTYNRSIGEIPISENEHMAAIARQALGGNDGG